MNLKTAKLIRRFASLHGTSPRTLRKRWNSTPKNLRENLRVRMESEIGKLTWAEKISEWRKSLKLLNKEAADVLGISVETLKNWEYSRNEPHRFVRDEISRRMESAMKSK